MAVVTISVIIPTYNSSQGLCDTLDAIINQREFDISSLEIIIVDNNSSDDTMERLLPYQEKLENLTVLSETKQGSYAARNKGISNSNGELLCFIDADVEPEDLFFKKVVDFYEKEPFDYAGVNVSIRQDQRSLASDYDALKAFHVEEKMRKGNYTPTITALVTKNATLAVNCFDERLESGGDVVFGKMIYQNGYKQIYLEEINVTHPARETLEELIKKAKRVARGYAYHMFYYNEMFNHQNNFFNTLNFYLPNNPLNLFAVSKKRNLNISFLKCFIAAFLAVPLSLITRKEFYLELKRLNNYHNTNY